MIETEARQASDDLESIEHKLRFVDDLLECALEGKYVKKQIRRARQVLMEQVEALEKVDMTLFEASI